MYLCTCILCSLINDGGATIYVYERDWETVIETETDKWTDRDSQTAETETET
jgi:hypothetical protein